MANRLGVSSSLRLSADEGREASIDAILASTGSMEAFYRSQLPAGGLERWYAALEVRAALERQTEYLASQGFQATSQAIEARATTEREAAQRAYEREEAAYTLKVNHLLKLAASSQPPPEAAEEEEAAEKEEDESW